MASPPVNELRAFVVDDDQALRQELVELLQRHGFSVQAFADGHMVAEKARRKNPHLILMDIQMPLVNGVRAAEQARLASPGSMVVLMSGYSKELVSATYADTGALTLLAKPLHKKELAAVIASAKRRANSRDAKSS